jgi:hypothetical protein
MRGPLRTLSIPDRNRWIDGLSGRTVASGEGFCDPDFDLDLDGVAGEGFGWVMQMGTKARGSFPLTTPVKSASNEGRCTGSMGRNPPDTDKTLSARQR